MKRLMAIEKAKAKSYRKIKRNITKVIKCLDNAALAMRTFLYSSANMEVEVSYALINNISDFSDKSIRLLEDLISGEPLLDYEKVEIRSAINLIADLEIKKEQKQAEYKKITDEKEKISCKRDLIAFELELEQLKKKIFRN